MKLTPPGGLGGAVAPQCVDPLFYLVRAVGRKKVASIWLKIGQRIAYGKALIATRGLNSRRNSYRFRAI